MPEERSIEVIINAKSGNADKEGLNRQLSEIFLAKSVNAHISIATGTDELLELAQLAVESKCETIVAGGGDGTVNAVASALVGTGKTLGILPLGTLNHFARDLSIPLELESAVQTIIANHGREVDVGEVNGNIFVNNSSLGLYPRIVSERQKRQRLGFGKWPAFAWAGFSVLRRYPFLDVRLNADGHDFASRTPFVFIGNNEYEMEGFNIGVRARLDAGKLSLYITRDTSRLGLIWLALRALFGKLRNAKDFISLCSEEIWIETRPRRLRLAVDGEVIQRQPPLHYRARRLALRVLVPHTKETSSGQEK